MVTVQVTSDHGPHALAELIASTQGEDVLDPKLAAEASMLRDLAAQTERERRSAQDADTFSFAKLDADNDWTDL